MILKRIVGATRLAGTVGMVNQELPERLVRMLTTTIESVARLEVLLYAREHRGRSCTARAVAGECHMSTIAAEQHLAHLCGRGYLTVGIASDVVYSFQPASPELEAAVEELAVLARTRREALDALLTPLSVPVAPAARSWTDAGEKNRR